MKKRHREEQIIYAVKRLETGQHGGCEPGQRKSRTVRDLRGEWDDGSNEISPRWGDKYSQPSKSKRPSIPNHKKARLGSSQGRPL